jgi:hypothetical protein
MTHNRKPDVLPVEGASIAEALEALDSFGVRDLDEPGMDSIVRSALERAAAEGEAVERLKAELTVARRVSEHRREILLQWRPEADTCLDCGVHRSLHHPIGPAQMADADCPCEAFVPFGIFDPGDSPPADAALPAPPKGSTP